jgi:O-acetyl-ADP-ribose deacetylase (regulator of RNase III)
MKIIKGNIIDLAKAGEFDIIIHGCNCFHIMGAGLAAQIKSQFPMAFDADISTIRGNESKLGTYSIADIPQYNFKILNCYTQYSPGRPIAPETYNTRLQYIRSCCNLIAWEFQNQRIGIPRIGAGLAGGNWDKIKGIINEELPNGILVEL